MTARRRGAVAVAAVALALLVPAAASAHAYLVKTVPAASVILSRAPPSVQLTYDEAVEPRFAIVSVTDVDAHQETTGPVTRSPVESGHARRPAQARRRGLVSRLLAGDLGRRPSGAGRVHVRRRPERRAGAAVQRSRTSPGTATSTPLVIAKWLAFLTVMTAIGLFVLRIAIARPLVRRVSGHEPAPAHDRLRRSSPGSA